MFCLSLSTGQSQRELLYSAVRVENMRSAELWTGLDWLDCLAGWEREENITVTLPPHQTSHSTL